MSPDLALLLGLILLTVFAVCSRFGMLQARGALRQAIEQNDVPLLAEV